MRAFLQLLRSAEPVEPDVAIGLTDIRSQSSPTGTSGSPITA
jgi:hypothetical protein